MSDKTPAQFKTPLPGAVIDVEIVKDATPRAHHRWGMSKLNYISDCPGWESAESSEWAKKAALEGEMLHGIMEKVLREWAKDPMPLVKILHAIIQANPVEDTQWEYLVFCCEEVEKHINRPGAQVFLEQKVQVKNPDGSELNHGYLDVLVIVGDVGVIVDYKFGWVMVRLAAANKQGLGYALGTLQRYAKLNKIGIIFIQPKLRSITRHILHRAELGKTYDLVKNTIDFAEAVQTDREKHASKLNPCDSCTYCARKFDCGAGFKHTLAVTRTIAPLVIPPALAHLDKIQTPQEAALCRYAVEVAEEFLEGIKKKAREIAEANGGVIEATLQNGETVKYEIERRRMDRSLGDTLEIVETLSPILDQARLFGAAEFSLGKLQKLVADEILENTNTPIDAELDERKKVLDAEVGAGKMSKSAAAKQMIEARKASGKITLAKAGEMFESILSSAGLLSRPDGEVTALRRKQTVKQVTQ